MEEAMHVYPRPVGWTRNGRPVWPIAGGSDDPASAPDPEPTPAPDPTPEPTPDPEPEPAAAVDDADPEPTPDDPPLGPEGEKALREWKRRAREAERQAKQAERVQAELEQLRAEKREAEKAQMDEHERALVEAREEAERNARESVLGEVRRERVETLVRAAATGKLTDPDDATVHLDLDGLDPDDRDGIAAAVDDLVESKPYLAVPEPAAPRPAAPAQGATRKIDQPPPDPGSMTMPEYREWKRQRAEARAAS